MLISAQTVSQTSEIRPRIIGGRFTIYSFIFYIKKKCRFINKLTFIFDIKNKRRFFIFDIKNKGINTITAAQTSVH